MPISIKGYVDDNHDYNQETPIKPKELLALFGVGDAFDRQKNLIQFDLNPRKLKKNRKGQELMPVQRGFPASFEATTKDGHSIEIAYYTRERKRTVDGETFREKYPKKVYFRGKSLAKERNKNLEEAVYFLLHPLCKHSPFHKNGQEWHYTFKDRQGESQVSLEHYNRDFEFKQSVLNEVNEKKLRRKARGIGIGRVDMMNSDEIKVAILNMYEKAKAKDASKGVITFSEQFINKYNADSSEITGLIEEALERQIITADSKRFKTTFLWGRKVNRTGIIVEANPGENPKHVLIDYLVDKWHYYAGILKKAVHEANLQISAIDEKADPNKFSEFSGHKPAPRSVSDMKQGEALDWAIKFDAIDLDRREKAVYFLDPKGNYDKKPLLEVKDVTEWKNETIKMLVEKPKVFTKLRQKIGRKYADYIKELEAEGK